MCGRFTQKDQRPEITEQFYIEDFIDEPRISYNVCPTEHAGVITADGDTRYYSLFKWGFFRSWRPTPFINSRSDNLRGNKVFYNAFQQGLRCIIPASGYYEFRKAPDGKKVPYYATLKSGSTLALAGLYEPVKNSDEHVFTVMTVAPNELMRRIGHERQPAILDEAAQSVWLDQSASEDDLFSVLTTYGAEHMQAWEVSRHVSGYKHKDEECIERVGDIISV